MAATFDQPTECRGILCRGRWNGSSLNRPCRFCEQTRPILFLSNSLKICEGPPHYTIFLSRAGLRGTDLFGLYVVPKSRSSTVRGSGPDDRRQWTELSFSGRY